MNKIFTLIVMAIFAFGLPLIPRTGAAEADQGRSMCSGSEKVVFSCSTGKKTVSICQTDAAGSIQYRYGKLGSTPELVLPENPATKEGVGKGMNAYAGGGGAYVVFTKNNTRYVVHDYTSRNGDDTGIDIERPGERTVTIPCAGITFGNLEQNTPASVRKDAQSAY